MRKEGKRSSSRQASVGVDGDLGFLHCFVVYDTPHSLIDTGLGSTSHREMATMFIQYFSFKRTAYLSILPAVCTSPM